MRQSTAGFLTAVGRNFSKLPIRQSTNTAFKLHCLVLSKLPMRQSTMEGDRLIIEAVSKLPMRQSTHEV